MENAPQSRIVQLANFLLLVVVFEKANVKNMRKSLQVLLNKEVPYSNMFEEEFLHEA